MSWQQKARSAITFGQDKRLSDGEKDKTTEDSSILRYIKTLTNHQKNAKQQRMDRYLQQVKHVQSAKNFSERPSKSPPYPSVTKKQHQQLQKRLTSNVKSRRNERVRNDCNGHKYVTAAANHSCFRSKRPCDKSHGDRQLKKPNKQAKQTTIIESLERFRRHGALSQKSAGNQREDGSKMPQCVTISTENKPLQSIQMRDLTRMPQTSNSGLTTMRTDLKRRSVQELRPPSVKAHAGSVPPQNPCSNFARPINFLSPEEAQPRNFDCVFPQQEVFIPTYDPLTTVMESIYF
ncbi:unnamed protein product [Peronospora destructor]|uniref:Uncharacterized protein n=1 Tax=Peronospora destructor TaxID=86335 RepID=A0AAV0V9M4_9STRA|nr:unnamed protein product [Peronospora destructor]